MSSSLGMPRSYLGLTAFAWFRLFKYSVYLLLCHNTFLFFQQDFQASSQVFASGVSWANLVEAYSATIDTAAWVVLLLMFELETAVIPDHILRGKTRWLLLGISSVCYFLIVYAFYGYWVKYGMFSNPVPFRTADICSLVGAQMNYVLTLDTYPPLTAAACADLQGLPLLQISGTQIVGSEAAIAASIRLAIVDIINAGDWLLVVALLQFEVYLRIKGPLSTPMQQLAHWAKVVLYSTLLACALFWWFKGDFLAFWDAFLWLVAFIFIELNIFEWSQEDDATQAP